MAMNAREKWLAGGVGVLAALFVGNTLVSSIQSGFDAKKEQIESLTKKKVDQSLQLTATRVARLKLNKLLPKSLPRLEESATQDYKKWLISLGDDAKLIDATTVSTSDTSEKDGSYHSYRFKVTGIGTIENATQLLYGFYSKGYLHRITQFQMRPIQNTAEPDQMNISLDCEVLALGIAKDKQDPPKNDANKLAKSLDEYKQTILGRNIFAPTNNPPALEPRKSVEAKIGLRLEHTVEAKDLDSNQRVSYELLGDVPKGLLIDKDSGKLSWSSNEEGQYKVSVQATDNGIPRKSSQQSLTINVKPLPPTPPAPIQFDVASQAMVTALIVGRNGPEAWILSKTESKTYKLAKGDQLKLGGVTGMVKDVGANYVEMETEGRVWLVGLDETLADAYSRSKTD